VNDVAGVRYITYVKIVLRAELLSSLCYWIMILQYRRHKNMIMVWTLPFSKCNEVLKS
jgi:hypothetical protein